MYYAVARMNPLSKSTRAWAGRLLAAENANGGPTSGQEREVQRICERLRVALTQFVGVDGFTALLRRALVLARAEVPSLQHVKVTTDGRLEEIETASGNISHSNEAALAITAHLLGLLVHFIGESLALRLVGDGEPAVSDGGAKEAEDEYE